MTNILLIIIYLSFISLGLPDGLLGAAWPIIHKDLGVTVSRAGLISGIIAVSTVISSLFSNRITMKLGAGKVTAASVITTALALYGFAVADSFAALCLLAVPYGLGAGSVDAALNNYVANNFTSRHMSWLHCMWGLGATAGPYIMGFVLSIGGSWSAGYGSVGLIQSGLCIILICTLGLWSKNSRRPSVPQTQTEKPMSLTETLKIPGAKHIMTVFFCYCAAEQTAMLWAGSYLSFHKGFSADRAAFYAGMFFIGITFGRFINGFLTIKFDDITMIRMGQKVLLIGCLLMMLPLGDGSTVMGLALIGLGCAPIYPCLLHLTPVNFGRENSGAVMGMQMASAYIGTCIMPPLFGVLADFTDISLMPVYLGLIIITQVITNEKLQKTGEIS